MSTQTSRLFPLLPALYRLKDAQIAQTQKLARGPLESLLLLIEEQLAVVAEDLDQLYDDQFIETCAPWVIPYIGDLIGYQPVHGVAPAVASPRAEVAHTIGFRRRKGTVLVLEQLARDVTGWAAHAVESFQLLADTQYLNHPRPGNLYSPDVRDWRVRAFVDGGFDQTAHTVDVRRIAVQRGRYNIPNIGIFLWSLNAYGVTKSTAAPVKSNARLFRFHPLGRDMALFNHPISQGAEITSAAQPVNVPDVLLRHALCDDFRQASAANPSVYYGVGKSLAVYLDGKLQDPAKVLVCNLAGDDPTWNNLPTAAGTVAIDPELGRIALAPGVTGAVQCDYNYGFAADVGGGEYPRESTFTSSTGQATVRVPGDYPSIHAALAALNGDGVVEVTDSATYREPGGLTVPVGASGHIELRAADGARPVLLLGAEMSVSGGAESVFSVNGLWIAYDPPPAAPIPPALIHAPAGANRLSQLAITHCTLAPGWALTPKGDPQAAYSGLPTLLAETSGLQVAISRSIVGGLWINELAAAQIADSIVDAAAPSLPAYAATVDASGRPQPGGALTLQGCTVIGKVYASLLTLVSDSIVWAQLSPADRAATPPLWAAPLWALRKQEGCVRFSFLPFDAITPRRFQCVELSEGGPQPLFYSLRFGDAGYGKLLPDTADAVRRGADDGGEMGAFHFLLAPLRETDLRVRIAEFMPAGLEFGVFYEN